MIYVGIDPGKSGAVAVVKDGILQSVDKCPATVTGMADLVKSLDWSEGLKVLIEQVHAMPKNGTASMFTFGQNYGQWQGVLCATGTPFLESPPQGWMKKIGSMPKNKEDRKDFIHNWAQKITGKSFPKYAADAVAMAMVAKQVWKD